MSDYPHGSVVEQVHRVWTTDQGLDPWALAEETVTFVRERVAREVQQLAQNRDPADPERSALYSDCYLHIADRIRHPERYSGVAQAAPVGSHGTGGEQG
jgi:hypothetical protein